VVSAHVSVLELHQFVTRGEGSAAFEAHVSACAACAVRLSAFARRHVAPLAVAAPDVEAPHRLAVVVMAFAACLMVMAVQSMRWPRVETAVAPEGVHGVARGDDPRLVESMGWAGSVDSGAVDSGVR
jgi:hypothetical protein